MLAALKEINQVHFHLCGVRETRNRCTCESEANMCRLAFINRGGKIKLNISTIATQGIRELGKDGCDFGHAVLCVYAWCRRKANGISHSVGQRESRSTDPVA